MKREEEKNQKQFTNEETSPRNGEASAYKVIVEEMKLAESFLRAKGFNAKVTETALYLEAGHQEGLGVTQTFGFIDIADPEAIGRSNNLQYLISRIYKEKRPYIKTHFFCPSCKNRNIIIDGDKIRCPYCKLEFEIKEARRGIAIPFTMMRADIKGWMKNAKTREIQFVIDGFFPIPPSYGFEWGNELDSSKPDLGVILLTEAELEAIANDFNIPVEERIFPRTLEEIVQQAKLPDYIIEPIIPDASLTVLAGKAGEGKSTLSLYLSGKISEGNNAEGDPIPVKRRGRVLYLDRENDDSVIKSRAMMLGIKNMRDIIYETSLGWYIDDKDGLKILEDLILRFQPVCVFIDSWTEYTNKTDENRVQDVRGVMRDLRGICRKYGISINLIHHLRKGLAYSTNPIDELRGSSAFAGSVDHILLLSGGGSHKVLRIIKSRYVGNRSYTVVSTEKEGKLKFSISEIEHDTFTPLVAKLMDEIRNYIAEEGRIVKRKEIGEAFKDYPKATVDLALKKLVEAKVIERVKKGSYQIRQTGLMEFPDEDL